MDTRLQIIAGPCSVDTEQNLKTIVSQLESFGVTKIRAGIWKPRTKPGSFQGIGEIGLQWMQSIKERDPQIHFGVEVASREHVELAVKHGVQILWIGARTVANPFDVTQIADALFDLPLQKKRSLSLMVKNPICPDIDLWEGAYLRLKDCGVRDISLIHRGFKTYQKTKYRNDPIWKIPLQMKMKHPDLKMICDPSHIAGDKFFVQEIMRQAKAYNFDGFIVEVHNNPSQALSDASQQITPMKLKQILDRLQEQDYAQSQEQTLASCRVQIDQIDAKILRLLQQRMGVSKRIGAIKRQKHMSVFQPERLKELLSSLKARARELGLSQQFVQNIWMEIHNESIQSQQEDTSKRQDLV